MPGTQSYMARGRALIMTVAVAVGAMAAALLTTGVANAAGDNPTATPLVSFTFDDGMGSSVTQAAPTLQKYGLTGTEYGVACEKVKYPTLSFCRSPCVPRRGGRPSILPAWAAIFGTHGLSACIPSAGRG